MPAGGDTVTPARRGFLSGGRLVDACTAVFIIGLLSWKIGQVLQTSMPPPIPGEWWGVHSFSDYLTLLGARRFFEEGFISNYFSANISVGFPEFARGWVYYQVPLVVQNSAMFYTHYGSLDTLFAGILMSLGVVRLTDFYLIYTLGSFLSLGLWYVSSALLFNRVAASVSTAAVGTSIMFISVAETPSAESIAIQLALLTVFFFVLARHVLKLPVAKIAAYAVVWAACFLQANNNPQFIFLVPAFIGGHFLVYGPRSRNSLYLFFGLCSAFVVGMACHLALNAWVLGGFQNMVADVAAAVLRRTTGFAMATEIGYRGFDIAGSPAYLENKLWNFMHLEFAGIAILVILLYWMIGRGSAGDLSALKKHWYMVVTMQGGGLVFIVIFIQAAVTQPMDVLKVMLPGIGSLLGLTAIVAYGYFRRGSDGFPVKSAFSVLLAVILLPYFQHIATGVPFSNIFQQTGYYQGGSPEQVREAAGFIKTNTRYGDVVLTNIHTGETGHIYYPHPAWEYLSGRRIEVFETVDQATETLKQLTARREVTGADNPARKAQFYVLLDRNQDESRLGAICRSSGTRTASFSSPDWWVAKYGSDPFPGDRRSYDLYLIDTGKWIQAVRMRSSGSQPPDNRTPWTDTVLFDGGIPDRIWRTSSMPRFSTFLDSGTLFFTSTPQTLFHMRLVEPAFYNPAGSTAEIRARILRKPERNPDGAIFSLQDGARELKLSFTGSQMILSDGNRMVRSWAAPGDNDYHVYRLVTIGNRGLVYRDGQLLAETELKEKLGETAVLFGDFAPSREEPLVGEIDYIACSARGAFSPDGKRLPA